MHLSLQVQKGDGGGLSLQQDDMKLNDSQFRAPHTGILYTPPKPPGSLWLLQHRDIVAISFQLDGT